MRNRIIAIFIFFFVGISSVFMFQIAFIIWLITVKHDKRLVILHLFSSFWASIYLWIIPGLSVSITGREKLDRRRQYIIVSNHQSQLDILVAFRLFFPFKWISKTEVFRIPFIGWNMSLNRYIRLKRGDKKSVKKMFLQCEKAINEGNSIYIFPEGTRSETGLLKPFKPGAFILAKKMKIPIIPIAINGTRNVLPKHSMNFHGGHQIRAAILDEIAYEKFASFPVKELAEKVRKIIAGHIDEHKGGNNIVNP